MGGNLLDPTFKKALRVETYIDPLDIMRLQNLRNFPKQFYKKGM